MKIAFALAAALTLSACGANGTIFKGYLFEVENPQAKAGTNETLLRWETVEVEAGKNENQLKMLWLLNAQDSMELTVKIELSDGTTYEFSAKEIQALGAFEVRAELEKAIATELGDLATPENIAGIAKLFGGGVVP